jgi:hypothetical protein
VTPNEFNRRHRHLQTQGQKAYQRFVGCSIYRRRGEPHPDQVTRHAGNLIAGRSRLNPKS